MIAIVLLERFIQSLLPFEETAATDLDQSAVLTWYVIALHVAHQLHDDETYATPRPSVTLALLRQFLLPIITVDPSQVMVIPLPSQEDATITPSASSPRRPASCPEGICRGHPQQPPSVERDRDDEPRSFATDDDERCRNMHAYFIHVLDWRLHVTVDDYVHACEHPDQHMVRRPVPRTCVYTPESEGAHLLLLTPATVAAASH